MAVWGDRGPRRDHYSELRSQISDRGCRAGTRGGPTRSGGEAKVLAATSFWGTDVGVIFLTFLIALYWVPTVIALP